MSKNNSLLELDVEKLFEERSIDYIVEIEKLLNAEIERKRNELRSMVGDRYKDVLAASDAIKTMKVTSKVIVTNIESITDTCEKLIENPIKVDINAHSIVNKHKIDERTVIIQLRLAIFVNEQIWIALDQENTLDAVQFFLLAQHIHTGLSFSKKEFLDKITILKQIKLNLTVLRAKIFQKITENLESVETTAEATSKNLNALMLLENQSCNDLLSIFIEHRKTALNTVISMPYSSVRVQISAMVRCLITTIRLLHECFINVQNGYKGLIWQQIQDICGESSSATLSKLNLPITPLLLYIPEVIKQFKPKGKFISNETFHMSSEAVIKKWLDSTMTTVNGGLEQFLLLIINIKGLHLAREEALKIDLPENWNHICKELFLPDNFDVWYFFFQHLFTIRCKDLISKKVKSLVEEVQYYILDILNKSTNSSSDVVAINLRNSVWKEEPNDVRKFENSHKGLFMKTKGFSISVVQLCEKMDNKYLELLEDVSQYLYGEEYNSVTSFSIVSKDLRSKKKFIDRTEIENHLRVQCVQSSLEIPKYMQTVIEKDKDNLVTKSIICARLLQAMLQLCPHFNKCCNFNNLADDWIKICDNFNKMNNLFWQNWVKGTVKLTENECEHFNNSSPKDLIKIMMRWDEIEIQEQTDEKTFKSQIKIPLKQSLGINSILQKLNNSLSLVLPHTLPKAIHICFIEENTRAILNQYNTLSDKEINQKQALQFLFDIKFLATLSIPKENVQLINYSHEICDKFRRKIDPFDLDVFYPYLQTNVKRAALQSQMSFGNLLPSSAQFANLGLLEKYKDQEQNPSVLALSIPSTSTWFPLLPIMVPVQKVSGAGTKKAKDFQKSDKAVPKKSQDSASMVRQGASFLSGLTTDWFS